MTSKTKWNKEIMIYFIIAANPFPGHHDLKVIDRFFRHLVELRNATMTLDWLPMGKARMVPEEALGNTLRARQAEWKRHGH